MTHSFIALYSGDSYLDSDLIAVSSDPEIVAGFVAAIENRIEDLDDEPHYQHRLGVDDHDGREQQLRNNGRDY